MSFSRRFFTRAPLAHALLLALASPAALADGVAQLPAISVTGADPQARGLRPLGPTPPPASIAHTPEQSVSVVGQQDIERLNSASTLDLLGRAPGVTVRRAGGIAGTVFLRGLDSNAMRVPMFIDGDRFRGRNTLQFMLISPTELEQVEIVRGPDSARFGSDALGGLINFKTRRAHGNLDQPFGINGGEASITYRSNGHGVQSNLALDAAGDGFDLRVYATTRRSSDYDSGSGKVPNSDFRGDAGGIVLGYMPDARQRIEASARVAYVKDGAAGTVPPYPQSISRRDPNRVKQARLAYRGEFDGTVREVDASLYVNEFDTYISARNASNPARVIETRNHVIGPLVYGGRVAASIPWADTDTTLGLDFTHERRPGSQARSNVTTLRPDGSLDFAPGRYAQNNPTQYQTNIGAFLATTWKPADRWTVSAGGRYDWFRSDVNLSPLPSPDLLPAFKAARNSTQNAVTGSLGLSYRATEVVELLGGVSTSFRMPWTSEMFSSGYTGTSYTIPNPGLKPERGRSVELGSRLHFEQATVGMTAFRSDFRDFLESSVTRYEGLPATQRRNVGRARIQGLEMDWRWQLTRSVNFYGNASYLHATNRNTDQPLQAIAPLNGLMGLQYVGPNEAYALSAELQWAKGQSRYDKRTEYPSPGYGTVNVYAQLQLDRLGLPRLGDTQLTLGVTNLFDRSYRTAATASNINYPMTDLNPLLEPGRSLMLTLRTRF